MSHAKFRDKVRAFVERDIAPYVHEWDETKTIPPEVYRATYAAGILPAVVGKPWPKDLVPECAVSYTHLTLPTKA